MSDRPLSVALAGCGHIARKHAELLTRLEFLDLAAVADVDAEAARSLAARHGVPAFLDHREMLDTVECDAVAILTPAGSHAAIAADAAEAGRHVLVEKPISLLWEDFERMRRRCEERAVELLEVKQYRFHLPVLELRRATREGRLGRLNLLTSRIRWCRPQRYYAGTWRGTWAMDGGVFANQALHHLDLLCWLGGPIESVQAHGARLMVEIEAEDTGVALLRFANGALGVVEATVCARPEDIEAGFSVLGSRGTVEIGGVATNQLQVWRFEDEGEEDEEIRHRLGGPRNRRLKIGHEKMYAALADRLRAGPRHEDLLVEAGGGARASLELLHAIYASIEEGREVRMADSPRSRRLGVVAAGDAPVSAEG